MTVDSSPEMVPIEDFNAEKQLLFFQALKSSGFTGKLSFLNDQGTEWVFFLYLGRIIYATGGKHPVRSWRRRLVTFLPDIAKRLSHEIKAANIAEQAEIWLTWDYYLLHLWLEQGKIKPDQVVNNIKALTIEVLFDLTQARSVNFELQKSSYTFEPLAVIDIKGQILATQALWSKWQELDFQGISPDLAPTVVKPEIIREKTSEKAYRAITRLLDGKHSIRDLAVQKQSSAWVFMRSIMPYIDLGAIRFLNILDLPYPVNVSESKQAANFGSKQELDSKQYKIAFVGNNSLMKQQTIKITSKLNCGLLEISNHLGAIPYLLEEEPDLILIDTELPESGGFEICSRLRKLDYLNYIPIILFGRNVSLVERMKSKMSGASELVEQSMDIGGILAIITKYLPLEEAFRTKTA